MNLVDTHSHIYLDEFAQDQAEMLQRAENEGVSTILLPAIDSNTHTQMLQLEAQYPTSCRSMMGLHPCYVKENYREELAIVQDYLEKRPFCAIGEIGLDFYWDKTFTDQQYTAFHQQIEWALAYGLPIAIHSRNATDECLEVVAAHQKGNLRGVFHCFSGDEKQARKAADLGFYLGIGGVLTFKNSGLDKVMEHTDLAQVILETDAPYLAPIPYRGKRNEPAYLKYVVTKLAQLKGISEEEVAAITTANAGKLFRI